MNRKKSKKKHLLKSFSSHLVFMKVSIEYYILIEFFQEIITKKTDNCFSLKGPIEKYYKNYGIFGDLWKILKEKKNTKFQNPLRYEKKNFSTVTKKVKFFRKKIAKDIGDQKNKMTSCPRWKIIT